MKLSLLVVVAVLGLTPLLPVAQAQLPAPPNTRSVDEADEATSPRRVVARRATAASPERVVDEAPVLPHAHHPWARFQPGAWRRIKITAESFDANGRFLGRSVTSQTETLKAIDETTCTLEVVSIVEIGGKRLRGAAQTVTLHLLCDEPCDGVTATRVDSANISLDGAVIPVERWSVEYGDETEQQTAMIYYSADRSPYVLRRELQAPTEGEAPLSKQSVIRVDAPLQLDGGIVPSSHVSITLQEGPTETQRFEVRCDAVPGGLVSASSTERDASGRRVRWSTVELEGYGDSEEDAGPRRLWPPFRRLRERES